MSELTRFCGLYSEEWLNSRLEKAFIHGFTSSKSAIIQVQYVEYSRIGTVKHDQPLGQSVLSFRKYFGKAKYFKLKVGSK